MIVKVLYPFACKDISDMQCIEASIHRVQHRHVRRRSFHHLQNDINILLLHCKHHRNDEAKEYC